MVEPRGSLAGLLNSFPVKGAVQWIGVRPVRKAPVVVREAVHAIKGQGLEGDHFAGRSNGKRQVTLIQFEHLDVISSLVQMSNVDPGLLRRNIVVAGINLLALRKRQFRVGECLLEMTGPCAPCGRMEEALGPGGFNAMRGHGGITARILESGLIRVGAPVAAEPA